MAMAMAFSVLLAAASCTATLEPLLRHSLCAPLIQTGLVFINLGWEEEWRDGTWHRVHKYSGDWEVTWARETRLNITNHISLFISVINKYFIILLNKRKIV